LGIKRTKTMGIKKEDDASEGKMAILK